MTNPSRIISMSRIMELFWFMTRANFVEVDLTPFVRFPKPSANELSTEFSSSACSLMSEVIRLKADSFEERASNLSELSCSSCAYLDMWCGDGIVGLNLHSSTHLLYSTSIEVKILLL